MAFWLPNNQIALAQFPYAEEPCGTSDVPLQATPPPYTPPASPCFSISHVLEEEVEIWVKLHIHVFLDDNCEGDFFAWNQPPVAQNDIYSSLQTMVNQTNGIMSNLNIAWSSQVVFGIPQAAAPAYLPIRFYIDRVSVHCNTAHQGFGSSPGSLNSLYAVPDAINLYMTEWVGVSNGQAMSIGGASTGITSESLSPTILIHEAMHLFN